MAWGGFFVFAPARFSKSQVCQQSACVGHFVPIGLLLDPWTPLDPGVPVIVDMFGRPDPLLPAGQELGTQAILAATIGNIERPQLDM